MLLRSYSGYPFTINISCSNVDDTSNSHLLSMCPVYDVTPACGRSGVEEDTCQARRVGLSTVCEYPVEFHAVDPKEVSGVDAFG